jgi:hypothetical protein
LHHNNLKKVAVTSCFACAAGVALAAPARVGRTAGQAAGLAEARLIEIYRMIAQGQLRQALPKARQLAADYPNFQLAHLLHGDLLTAMNRPLKHHGDVGRSLPEEAAETLASLREESLLRLKALRDVPPHDGMPAEFLQLSPVTKHALAVDTSKARLYLLENNNGRLRVVSDFYISVGKLGDAPVSWVRMLTAYVFSSRKARRSKCSRLEISSSPLALYLASCRAYRWTTWTSATTQEH